MIAALVVIGDGCGGTAVDPTGPVVTIAASGCRLRPVVAVGVVVGDGLVATVAHSVAGEDEITVRTRDGVERPAVVAAIDTALDAAVLRVDGLDVLPAVIRPADVDEELALVVDVEGTLTERPATIVRRVTVRTSDIYREGTHDRPGLEIAAEVSGGDSGAPLVNTDGSVVGMVWATSRRDEGRAWALPIEALDPLLVAAESGAPPPPVPCAR